MKAVKFKHQNSVFGEDQKEYPPVPALKMKGRGEGVNHIVSCWKLTFRERFKVLVTGRVWVCTVTKETIQPQLLSIDRKKVYKIPSDDIPFRKKNIAHNAYLGW